MNVPRIALLNKQMGTMLSPSSLRTQGQWTRAVGQGSSSHWKHKRVGSFDWAMAIGYWLAQGGWGRRRACTCIVTKLEARSPH